MLGAGRALTSEEWLALGRFLFGVKVDHVREGRVRGNPITLQVTDSFLAKLVADSKVNAGYLFYSDFEYYCSSCDKEFKSFVTPTRCPSCKKSADDDAQKVALTHKGYTANTFPFFKEIPAS
jgi:hypothetical protein